jgi:iduronate 2-sulfatase
MKVHCLFLLIAHYASAENLLFIAVDDLSSRIGDPYAITPNLDKIHNESIVFTKQFATSPECGPSRTSMLTSLKVENHKIEHFENFRQINPKVITLPGLLRVNGGYFTSGVGKVFDFWNFGGRADFSMIKPDLCTTKNNHCSFDRFYSMKEILRVKPPESGRLYNNLSDGINSTDDFILQSAMSQLQDFNQRKIKFALFVGFTKPHMPFDCHDSFYRMYENVDFSPAFTVYNETTYFNSLSHSYFKSINREAGGYTGFNGKNPVQYARAYYACMSQTDTMIGKLVESVDSFLNLKNNTIVVIWGDHGFSVGERRLFGKKTLFENANKSPFMIRLPSRNHRIIDTPISNIDIYPTIAELLNVAVAHKIDGASTMKLVNRHANYTHPVPFSSFEIYGPAGLIGISKWYKTNTTMSIHKRSSSNRLKPVSTPFILRVYKPNTDERELISP